MVDGTTGARRWDLPAPVTVTDIYILALIERLDAIEAALERMIAAAQPAEPPASGPAKRRRAGT